MKNIYFNTAWLLLALLCVGVTGCKKELEPIAAEGEPVPVYVNLSTKSFGTDTSPEDTRINNMRLMLFRAGSGEVAYASDMSYTDDKLQIYVETGYYTMYIITNENYDTGQVDALNDVLYEGDLQRIHLPYDVSNRDFTNIPMIASFQNVRISEPTSGVSSPENPGSINGHSVLDFKLKRLASKINMTISIPSNFGLIKSSRIMNIPTSIPLIYVTYSDLTNTQEKIIDTNSFVLQSEIYDGYNTFECENILVPSLNVGYGSSWSNAMLLKLELESGNIVSVPLSSDGDNNIYPNCHYFMNIVILNDLTFSTLIPNPWQPITEDVEIL